MIIFFFNDTATTEIYTLSLHDALPICAAGRGAGALPSFRRPQGGVPGAAARRRPARLVGRLPGADVPARDRKSTRLNSSYANISYAVFCLKKKKKRIDYHTRARTDYIP